jgi:hypothetical protein
VLGVVARAGCEVLGVVGWLAEEGGAARWSADGCVDMSPVKITPSESKPPPKLVPGIYSDE